ncbi:MAG: glycoside hydrolase family 32 protein [Anaerolineae bacterium]|nr:glycoside hydrolase family 32 protein [Anaerolineae bacterium]
MNISDNAFRPRFHFTPSQNWMNDPNGLVYYDGEYHLFYQYNPYAISWGHMSWGHAVSHDLLHWEYLPVAIEEEPAAGYTIFSGSAVIDYNNASGFGKVGRPAMVAIYTADYREPRVQDIHIAYSTDRGRTFTKYAGNPVIAIGEQKFGDPKVFWHAESHQWIMVNICGVPQGHVVFYGSPDLKHWKALSEFHAPEDAPGVWECPDLFPLAVDGDPARVKWVLKTNNVGFGAGLHGTRYFVGDFDGAMFSNARLMGTSLTSDQGIIYAEVTYNDAPEGRRILMGWLRQSPDEARPWTGAQAIPRELSLCSGVDVPQLCHAPVVEIHSLREQCVHLGAQHLSNTEVTVKLDLTTRALEILMEFVPGSASACGMRLQLDNEKHVDVGYMMIPSAAMFIAYDDQRLVAPLQSGNGLVKLHIFFDQDIVEAFCHPLGGLTMLLPYGSVYTGLSLYVHGGDIHLSGLEVWK